MDEKYIELQLTAAEWLGKESDRVLERYKTAKTEAQRAKLVMQLYAIKGKLQSEIRNMDKILD